MRYSDTLMYPFRDFFGGCMDARSKFIGFRLSGQRFVVDVKSIKGFQSAKSIQVERENNGQTQLYIRAYGAKVPVHEVSGASTLAELKTVMVLEAHSSLMGLLVPSEGALTDIDLTQRLPTPSALPHWIERTVSCGNELCHVISAARFIAGPVKLHVDAFPEARTISLELLG